MTTFEPASYPSVVYGWHWGTFYGPYSQARRVSNVTSIPSTWSFSVPVSGQYNLSYDLWMHQQNNPPDPDGGLELMIWVSTQGNAIPFGDNTDSMSLDDAGWEVWYGTNPDSWDILTYRRTTDVAWVDMDLVPFVTDAVGRGYVTDSWYLLGVQAGFEIWQRTETMTTDCYSVEIL